MNAPEIVPLLNKPLRVLAVEDCEDDLVFILAQLRQGGYEPACVRVDTEPDFSAALDRRDWDLIIADYSMPQFSVPVALRLLQRSGLDIPFIIVSGAIGEEVAVTAMKSGAHDYILKHSLARLVPAVERELRDAQVRRERRRAEEAQRRLESEREGLLQRFQAVLDRMPIGCILSDADFRFTYWNPAAEEIFGYRFEEVRGRHPFGLITSAASQPLVEEIFRRVTAGDLVADGTSENMTKSGRTIICEWKNTPLRQADGTFAGIISMCEDVTDRKGAEEELRTSRLNLRALAAHLQSVREEERKLITREIHDELGQSLTGFKMDLAWMRNRLKSESEKDALIRPPLLEKIAAMGTLLDGTASLMRKLCTELRPGVLDDLGLTAAIEWQAREYQIRTGLHCKVSLELGELVVDPERSTALFRIFQEILTNVARHAQATRVDVSMKKSKTHLSLEVKDNGRGIKESEKAGSKSLGLLGMRERAIVLGGEVEIRGRPGKGTTVRVIMPLPPELRDAGNGHVEARNGN